jgi:hypothetical protein
MGIPPKNNRLKVVLMMELGGQEQESEQEHIYCITPTFLW